MAEAEKCSPPLRASEIGVMAPWREQVWKLRVKLREAGLSSVDVGSVEVSFLVQWLPPACLISGTRITKAEKTVSSSSHVCGQVRDSWMRITSKVLVSCSIGSGKALSPSPPFFLKSSYPG